MESMGSPKQWMRRLPLFTANALYLLSLCGITLAGMLFSLVLRFLPPDAASAEHLTLASYLVNALTEIGFIALPCALSAHRRPGSWRSMRLNPPSVGIMLLSGLAALIGVPLFTYLNAIWMALVEALGGRFPTGGVLVPGNQQELLLSLLAVGVLPGICEELLFRGALLGAWERRGSKYALMVTSALFMLAHGSVAGMPSQFLIGLLLGFVAVAADSIYPAMLYHTLHNSLLMLVSYAAAQREPSMEAAEQALFSGELLQALLLQTGVFAVLMGLILLGIWMMRAHRDRDFEQLSVVDRRCMDWRTLVVLLCALVTGLILCGADLLRVAGVL